MGVNTRTSATERTTRLLLAALIGISTVLFVVGVTIERTSETNENPAIHQEAGNGGSSEGSTEEAAEGAEGTHTTEGEESQEVQPTHDEASKSSELPTGAERKVSEDATAIASNTTNETNEAAESSAHQDEQVLGIDMENPWIVGVAVVGWLALLAGLFLLWPAALPVIAVVAVAFTIFGIAEVAHQIGNSNTMLVAIALLVAVCHAAIAVLSALAFTRSNKRVKTQSI